MKLGWKVGGHCYLTKRITIKYGKGEDDRKDQSVGTQANIVGFEGKHFVICGFDVKVSAKKHTIVNWKVPITTLSLQSPEAAAKDADAKESTKGLPFIGDGLDVDVIPGNVWMKQNISADEGMTASAMKTIVQFELESLLEFLPKYTEKDFCILKRKNDMEIWTLKAFAPETIKLAPFTTEVKERFWTQNRSVIVHHSGGKPLVLDGRVRASVEGKTPFALFWIVSRAKAEKAHECNLELEYVGAKVSLEFGFGDKTETKAIDKAPSIPILTNKKAIKKHVKLCCLEDMSLKALYDKQAEEKEAERKAADQKKKKEEEAKKAEEEKTSKVGGKKKHDGADDESAKKAKKEKGGGEGKGK